MLASEISLWGEACTIFHRKCLVGLWLLALPLAALVFVGCDKDNTNTNALSPYDMNCPVGFGANVTGGGRQNVVTVTTQEALRAKCMSSTAFTMARTTTTASAMECTPISMSRNVLPPQRQHARTS